MTFPLMGIEAIAKDIDSFEKSMDTMKRSIGDVGAYAAGAVSPMDQLSKAFDVLAVGVVSAAAAMGSALVGGLAAAIKEASDAQEVWTQLEAVIASTGGISGVTAGYAQELAMQFRDLAGGSDETIASIIEMGLRMGTITADQMPDFIQTVLDLAAATGTDAANAARLLAEAQDDPISALGRFRKLGILIDKETEKRIKLLMEQGKVEEANALLLEKVGVATQGRAAAMSKTFSGQLAILKNHIGEVFEEIGTKLLPVLTPLIEKFIELSDFAGKKLVDMFGIYLLPILEKLFGVLMKLLSGDWMGALQDIIPQSAIDKIIELKDTALDFIDEFITPFVQKHGPTMEKAIIAIGIAFATWKIVNAVGTLTSLLSTLTPLGLALAVIGAAVTLFAVVWDNDWAGIRTTLTDVWETTLKPALEELGIWLQENLPIAAQAFCDFMNSTFVPVIQAVSAWFGEAKSTGGQLADIYNAYLLPAIQALANIWQNVLIPAIQAFANIWQNVLLPAIMVVADWIVNYVVPLWMSVANLFSAILGKALELYAGIWQNVLYPALEVVTNYVIAQLQPVFQAMADLLTGVLIPILQTMADLWTSVLAPILQKAADFILPAIVKGFEGIKAIVKQVTDMINDLAEAIRNIDLGDLTPGSPTPFEIGLRGVAKALKTVNREMNDSLMLNVSGSVSAMPVVGPSGSNRTSNVTNESNILEGANIYNNTPFDIQAFAEVVRGI